MKARIFNRAWKLRKVNGMDMGKALRQAWRESRMQKPSAEEEQDKVKYYLKRVAFNPKFTAAQRFRIYVKMFDREL